MTCARRWPRRTTRCEVRIQLSPAWTTDWLSEAGREKLLGYGIAPPNGRATLPLLNDHGAGGLPAMRIGGRRGARRLRLDAVQGVVALPLVPGAVRLLQGALRWRAPSIRCGSTTSAARLPTRCRSLSTSPTSSREAFRFAPGPVPHLPGRRVLTASRSTGRTRSAALPTTASCGSW